MHKFRWQDFNLYSEYTRSSAVAWGSARLPHATAELLVKTLKNVKSVTYKKRFIDGA